MSSRARRSNRGRRLGPGTLGAILAAAALLLTLAILNRDTASGLAGLLDLLSSPRPDTATGAALAGASPGASTGRDSAGTSRALAPAQQSAAATAAAGADNPFRFGVTVAPLVIESSDSKAVISFRLLYETFVTELAAIPNVRLVEIASTDVLATDEVAFELEVMAISSTQGERSWSLSVAWTATVGGNGAWSTSGADGMPTDVKQVARDAADGLRQYPFPPADTRPLELEGLLLEASLRPDERADLLDELRRIPERFAFVGRDEQRMVSVAAAETVANSDDAELRGEVWRAMEDVEDPYLVGPLIDSLTNDTSEFVRIQAVRLLAKNFSGDPRAMSALDYIMANDFSRDVRTHAIWESLDETGRRQYVGETLLNPALPDADRIALVAADVTGLMRYIDRPVVDALVDIASRAHPSAEPRAPGAVAVSANAAYVVVPLIELLQDNTIVEIRRAAAEALIRHVDEPGVREALERSARYDSSYGLRMQLNALLRQLDD